MSNGTAALAWDGVSVSFDHGHRYAVRDVTAAIAKGSFVALVGTSGSGKTSLLKTINRLVRPCAGTLAFAGEPIDAMSDVALRRQIGYVFQGIGLFPHMSVAENIGITPALLGWPRERIRARVEELIDLVQLPRDYLIRMPDELSGGQRQRIGVARALAATPKVVLMDEPFGALDPITRDTLGRAFRTLHEALGLTTIMVTHDVQEAVLLADRILVMQDGRLVDDGTPRAFLAGDCTPAVAELFALPRRHAERIHAMTGAPVAQP